MRTCTVVASRATSESNRVVSELRGHRVSLTAVHSCRAVNNRFSQQASEVENARQAVTARSHPNLPVSFSCVSDRSAPSPNSLRSSRAQFQHLHTRPPSAMHTRLRHVLECPPKRPRVSQCQRAARTTPSSPSAPRAHISVTHRDVSTPIFSQVTFPIRVYSPVVLLVFALRSRPHSHPRLLGRSQS